MLFRRRCFVRILFVLAACLSPGAATVAGEPRQPPLEKLDASLAKASGDGAVLWYDVRHLGVEGRGWDATREPFDRLPAKAEGVVRAPVWSLSRHSAGMCVRFVTDAQEISARWTLRSPRLAMNHMPATGVSGVDLYGRHEGGWQWIAVGRPGGQTNSQRLVSGLAPGVREYALYLPLYNGVTSVELGLPKTSFVAKPHPWPAVQRPICFYGTSITQGGCASRPGMAYPAILGRRLGCPTINLGFSGNGRMEPEMADLIAELDAAVFVIDTLPNMDADLVRQRTIPLVERLRKDHPETPIVLVENVTYQNAPLVAASKSRYESKNEALRAVFKKLRERGVPKLHLVPGAKLLGDDGEATVDGTHPTDLGFKRMAEALEPVLRGVVDGGGNSK